MVRPYEIERHERRMEIDFVLAQKLSFAKIAEHFGFDQKTVAHYSRRMLASQPDYFARLRIGHPLPPKRAFIAASMFAQHNRDEFLRAAEAAFSH